MAVAQALIGLGKDWLVKEANIANMTYAWGAFGELIPLYQHHCVPLEISIFNWTSVRPRARFSFVHRKRYMYLTESKQRILPLCWSGEAMSYLKNRY